MAGAIPSMVVSQRVSMRPALGTGAYAGGIVLGSALAAAIAVPLSGPAHDWRQALLILSIAAFLPIAAWLILIQPDPNSRPLEARAPRLPWRSTTGWLLVLVFGLQSLLYYGVVSWLPNALVERGWAPADAGAMSGLLNGVGLLTTLGVPLVADRLGARRGQLLACAFLSLVAMTGIVAVPDLAIAWVVLMGLGLGAIFPLVLTLPIDVADEPAQVGSVAALMLLGGYLISAGGPVVLGVARDLTGDFETSLWLLVGVGVALTLCCTALSPARLHRGIRRIATP
jgi:CP family cyanate transporter-like MFS transporter